MDLYVCALEFENDGNLLGRKYMYRADFKVDVGDKLIAPIGVHNKLQVGVVRQIFLLRGNRLYRMSADGSPNTEEWESVESLGYPINSVKSAVCRYGFRRAAIPDCVNARDLGGIFYDEKHLTAYGNFVRADIPRGDITDFNFAAAFYFSDFSCTFGVKAYRFPVLYRPYAGKKERLVSKFPFFTRIPMEDGGYKVERIYNPTSSTAENEENVSGDFALADGAPKEKVFRAYGEKELMHSLYFALAHINGAALICDEYGGYSVDIAVAPLYLLIGIPPESIYKDYALSDYCINEKYIEGDKFGENEYVPEFSEREYVSLLKEFIKRYGSAEKYFKWLGLGEDDVTALKEKMTVYKNF